MSEPDPQQVIQAYLAMRSRHAAQRALANAAFEEELLYWEGRPLLERRLGWRESHCPRFLYKYRLPLTNDWGQRCAEDVLLRHQLWLAEASKYSDDQDSRVDYRVSLSGDALRQELAAHARWSHPSSRFAAERMVSDRVVADPAALATTLNANAERILRDWGICSLAANARSVRMWNEYSDGGQGVCFQFLPATDFRAFIDAQPVVYSDTERVIENRMFGDAVRERRLDLLMTKRTRYAYEDEWRIVAMRRANVSHAFAPAALTGVLLGPNAAASRTLLADLLVERHRQTGLMPRVYQAQLIDGSIRILQVTASGSEMVEILPA